MSKDGYIGLGIGIVLLLTARFAKGIRHGLSGRKRPWRPITKAEQIVILIFAILFLAYGIAELAPR